ncbi:hypothetical protein [Streptomyces yaizuensis]|uniref:Uncharacterized protein n=1 Tax=Streptomyces yaizuensis TaxID=2989713 RepID=A0ABQ5P729_9ACTN|nr:hypothetical protein [Streptomyces sp. YSPA8]GLF98046.1 hypothetical protein SYYSPA8_27135 [Streptomyces sp. YSPA8]
MDTLYESAPSAIALMRTAVVVIAPFAALYVTMTLLLAWVEAATATPDRTGLLAVLTEPVRTYLDGQAAALPISGETAYRAWQFSGCAAFLLAACRRGSGRAIWGLWGAASVAMVWMGTPETGRAAAAGIAVFAWSAAATVAWRGLRLRRPAGEIHLPEPRIDVHLHQSPSVLTPYRVDSRSTWLN